MAQCSVWWAHPLAETSEHLALLAADERARYARYRHAEDRFRFLTGRVLAKTLAADRLGVSPADIEFDATCPDCGRQHGAPQVPGTSLHLSIAHSGHRVGVAMADGVTVGLDVEGEDRVPTDSLLSYVLGARELDAIRDLSETARREAFLTYWTRKEAIMKATGLGLRLPLRDLVLSRPDEPARLLDGHRDRLSPESTRLADLAPGVGYRAAIAVFSPEQIDVREHWWPTQPDIR